MRATDMTHVLAWLLLAVCLAVTGCTADGDTAPGDPIGGGGGGGGDDDDDGGGDDGGDDGGGGGDTTLVCAQPIGGPGASAVGTTSGLCLGCAVDNPQFAIDAVDDNFAAMNLPVGLLGGAATLTLTAPAGVAYPAGMTGGVTINVPAGLLAADVLPNVTVTTLLAGSEQETADSPGLLSLSALGIPVLGGGELMALSFDTTQPFDGVAVTATAALASVLSTVEVYGGCGEFVEVPAS